MFDQIASAYRYGDAIIQSQIVLLIITTVALAFRLCAKFTTKARLGIDDVMVIIAQLFWYTTAGAAIRAAYVGKNLKGIDDPNFGDFSKFTFVGGAIYTPTVLFISLSVLFFYRRIFPVQEFRRITDIVIALHVAWALAVGLAQIFMCSPVWIAWSDAITFITNIDKCINYPVLFVIGLSIELVLNVVVLALPIRETIKLQLNFRMKCMLACVFLLGGASIISGIVRIQQSYVPGDKFIDLAGDMYWISIHEATALIAASLPIYRPLMRSSINFMSSTIRKVSGGGSYGSNRSGKESSALSGKGYISAPSVHSERELVGPRSSSNNAGHEVLMTDLKEQPGKIAVQKSYSVV